MGGALFLWLASARLRLWPHDPSLPAPWLLVLALAVHVPYALVRAMRLRYLLDPVVAAADPDRTGLRRGQILRVSYGCL